MRTNFKGMIIVVALGVALAACTPATSQKPSKPLKLNAAQMKLVQQGVKEKFKDPDSAKFGSFAATITPEKVITVCGDVNAKNSFGGYTGMRRFIGNFIDNKTFYAVGISSSDSYGPVDELCRQAGL